MSFVKHKKNNAGLGFVSFIFLLALIGALIAVWFKIINPFLYSQKLSVGDQKFEFNKFSEAELIYDELLKKASPQDQQLLKDRLAQLPFAQKHLVDLAPENPSIILQPLEGVTGKIGLMYIHYAIQNNTTQPIPIRRSLFYLKSTTGKSEVALDRPQNKEVGSWSGDLLPGERAEGGICVKYVVVDPNEKVYLVYSNGKTYVNAQLIMSRIWPQTAKDQFKEGWLGRKTAPLADQRPQPITPQLPKVGPRPAPSPAIPPSPKTEPLPPSPIQSAPTPAKLPVTQPPQTQIAPPRPVQAPDIYVDPQYDFAIKIPKGWEKINPRAFPGNSYVRFLPAVTAFKGPTWKERFPILLIQKTPYGAGINIDQEVLNKMEREIRTILKDQKPIYQTNYNMKIDIKQLTSRTSLIGNTQVAEIDLIFYFGDKLIHMKSYVLEGSTGYMLSYVASFEDFNTYSNQAIQAIRSFKPK